MMSRAVTVLVNSSGGGARRLSLARAAGALDDNFVDDPDEEDEDDEDDEDRDDEEDETDLEDEDTETWQVSARPRFR